MTDTDAVDFALEVISEMDEEELDANYDHIEMVEMNLANFVDELDEASDSLANAEWHAVSLPDAVSFALARYPDRVELDRHLEDAKHDLVISRRLLEAAQQRREVLDELSD